MRARSIDWLRGAAAVVMVQCHALALVRPESRKGVVGDLTAFFDGLVAPAFYLCAGFALAFTMVGAARRGQVMRRSGRIAWRTAQILAVSAALTAMWFPILEQPQWLLRIDVLSVIGVSLLALLPLCALLASRPRVLAGALFALTAAIWLFAPALSHVRGPFAPFLGISTGSVFPPVPWGGHVALGAAAGALIASGALPVQVWSGIALGTFGLSGLCFAGAWANVFPAHDPWSEPWNQFQRALVVSSLALGLTLVDSRVAFRAAGPVRKALEWYGQTSLSLYAIHEVWLYTPRLGFCFNDAWGQKLGWGGYALATVALLGVSTACVGLIDAAEHLARHLASKLVGGDEPDSHAHLAPRA